MLLDKGEQCASLTSTTDDSTFAIVTTHLRVFVVGLYDEHNLGHRELKKPSGFGFLNFGLSLFGGQTKRAHTVKRVLATVRQDKRCNLLILTDEVLQWWVLSPFGEPDVCLFDRPIKPELVKQLNAGGQQGGFGDVEFEPVDIQVSSVGSSGRGDEDSVTIYLVFAETLAVAGHLGGVSLALTYRLWGMDLSAPNTGGPASSNSATIDRIRSKQTFAYSPAYDKDSFDYFTSSTHFVLPADSRAGYLVNRQDIVFTRVPVDDRPLDVQNFDLRMSIIGCGEMDKVGLLILAPEGIARVSQPGTDLLFEPLGLGAHSMDVDVPAADTQANVEPLMSRAFKQFQLNDPGWHAAADVLRRTDVNEIVAKQAEQIVDAPPTSDPRWANDPASSGSYQQSLAFISQQLDEKRRKLHAFIHFLGAADLLQTLTPRTLGKLSELREKVTAAANLRAIQSTADIWTEVSSAIGAILEDRKVKLDLWQQSGFGPQDIFFSRISRIDEILVKSLMRERALLTGPGASYKSLQERFELVGRTNQIFKSVLFAAQREREESRESFFPPISAERPAVTAQLWTCTDVIRTALTEQMLLSKSVAFELTKEHNRSQAAATTVHAASSAVSALREQLDYIISQLSDLSAILLGDFKFELELVMQAASVGEVSAERRVEALRDNFDGARRITIQYFMDLDKIDWALQLAEAYLDFNTLVSLCDRTNDDFRLSRYLQEHGPQFASFLFEWYEANQKIQKLLQQPPELWDLLRGYLADKPALLWLHQITMSDWGGAAKTLQFLASAEGGSFQQYKTYFSLAKLNYIADGVSLDSEQIVLLDDYLQLCRVQTRLIDMFPSDSVRSSAPPFVRCH